MPPSNDLSFSQKFVRGQARYSFWGMVTKGFSFVNTVIILASVTVYEYGVFQLVLSLYSAAIYFTTIGDGVVNNDISRLIGENKESEAKKLFFEYNLIRMAVSVVLWALFFFGATAFAQSYTLGFVEEIRLISFLFLTDFIFSATESLLESRLEFTAVARRYTSVKFIQCFVLIGFLWLGHIGLGEIFISMIFGSLLSTLTLIPAFIRIAKKWEGIAFAKEKMLLLIFSTYGKWSLYRQFVSQTISRVQPWLIKIFVGTEAVAIFSVATSFIGVIKDFGFPTDTLSTLVPLHLGDREKTQQIFIRGLRYIFALSILVSLGAFLAVPLVIKVFFHQYVSSLPFFNVMLVSIPLFAIGIITGTFIIALRKQKFLFFLGTTSSLLTLFFYIVFLPRYGLWALSAAQVVIPLITIVMTYFYMLKIQPGVRFNFRQLVTFSKEDITFIKLMYKDIKKMIVEKYSSSH